MVGGMLAMPGDDPQAAAAKAARRMEQVANQAEDTKYSTSENLYKTYQDWQRAEAAEEGHPYLGAFNQRFDATMHWFGSKRYDQMITQRSPVSPNRAMLLDSQGDNKELRMQGAQLYREIIRNEGGIDKVAGAAGSQGAFVRSQYEEAGRMLLEAAKHLKEVQGKRMPTMLGPDKDK
jgi:hypothetical protein